MGNLVRSNVTVSFPIYRWQHWKYRAQDVLKYIQVLLSLSLTSCRHIHTLFAVQLSFTLAH